jgi:hypothetical protein
VESKIEEEEAEEWKQGMEWPSLDEMEWKREMEEEEEEEA